jgi:hypothetical protein
MTGNKQRSKYQRKRKKVFTGVRKQDLHNQNQDDTEPSSVQQDISCKEE